MIMCCRQKHMPFVTVKLEDEKNYSDRRLEIAVCPVCGALIAELRQFNCQKSCYETVRPKRKHTAAFIKRMQEKEWRRLDIETGTKSNAGYIYGINREYKDGSIHQYACDFNGVKKLVKVIN